ncbi:MAG: carbohydrate kinase family protein [Clostridiales bacterium]|jgi:hypothetical protein|nr:carbohydrate kinase family protein [Clostridiales bacterium]
MTTFKETAAKLRAEKRNFKAFAGLDGFVDEIIHIVEKRTGQDADDYIRYEKIEDFGKKVKEAGGLSANFEMIPIQVKLGGNGPIFANALLNFDIGVTYCGSIGYPDIHPVFKPMANHPGCTAISKWEPAHTDALEFQDGKLIMGKMRVVYDITWEKVKDAVGGVEKLAEHMSNSDLLGMLNWTMLPFMGDVWDGMLTEALPLCTFKDGIKPLFFFDIADPAKRTGDDIRRALEQMGAFNKYFRVVLGLNEKESYQIAGALGIDDPERLGAQTLSEEMFKRLSIDCLVIHPTTEAYAITKEGFARVKGPYCENPKLTTGAGDNFNAGFCLGLLCGFGAEESLRTGVSASGYYVRQAGSPATNQLADFMDTID